MKTKTSMNIEKEKLDIIRWVTTLNDETSIERLKMLKDNPSKTDWWDDISELEKNAIEEGLADIKAGKLKSHEEARRLYEKWL